MQCHDARNKLAEYNRTGLDISADPELMEHVRKCPECARDLVADNAIQKLFVTAGADDTEGMMPMAQCRIRVEAQAVRMSATAGRRGFFKWVPANILTRRPALSFGTIAAVVVLAILAFVPFSYHHTVGYTITMEGVNQKLAGDIGRICDMLHTMGLEDAEVDILGCDTSCDLTGARECDTICKLLFVELKTREEAQRVVSAFTRIDSKSLTTNIEPVITRTSGTLLDRANRTILQKPFDSN